MLSWKGQKQKAALKHLASERSTGLGLGQGVLEGREVRDQDRLAMEAFEFGLADDGEDLLPEGVRDFAEAGFQNFDNVLARLLMPAFLPAFLAAFLAAFLPTFLAAFLPTFPKASAFTW